MKELSMFLIVLISFLLLNPKPKDIDMYRIEMEPFNFEYKENTEVMMVQKRIDSLHKEVLKYIRNEGAVN